MGYLTEKNGQYSATRLIFIIGSIWNMVLCSFLVFQEIEPSSLIAVFATIEAVFVGLKLGQKPMEQKT